MYLPSIMGDSVSIYGVVRMGLKVRMRLKVRMGLKISY